MISFAEQPGGGSEQDPAPKHTAQRGSIDTANMFQVVAIDGQITILGFPTPAGIKTGYTITKEQAVNLAAWLMMMADPTGEKFERVVKEIAKS